MINELQTKISAYIEWIESQRNFTGYLDEWYIRSGCIMRGLVMGVGIFGVFQ